MGRRGFPPEFRRRVLDLVETGRTVRDAARDLQISEQTIYVWRRQDRIDRGLDPGISSVEKAELAQAKRRTCFEIFRMDGVDLCACRASLRGRKALRSQDHALVLTGSWM